MIPNSYNEWRECIVNDCGIELTKDFAKKRLEVLSDRSNPETIKFKSLYGEDHLINTLKWFGHVANN
jgi:hypothetical protein